ncbi:MAG: sigma-70 family RNA polymerase sigma factor [candidate division WOR-3 bacterium]
MMISQAIAQENLTEQEEYRLIRAAQEDLRQFAPLYEQYLDRIYRYIAARVGDGTMAEDLTSEVFLKALENLSRYRPSAPFAAWIFTIAHHTVASHFRQRPVMIGYHEPFFDRASSGNVFPPQREGPDDDLAQLHQLLARLDEEDRELLRLRFAGGLTYREAAMVLGRSPGAVKMATHRLLQRLRHEMEKDK